MLRPERMSRVSVTGSKRVMDDVIGTVYDLRLLDLTDYDGAWEGFDPGSPIEGADEASNKLVTVRALQSTLGVTEEDAGPTRIVTKEALEEDLEEIRTQVNELDDRRSDLRDDIRAIEERIEAVEPFVDLGIDLDLLGDYEHLTVRVGEGDPDTIERVLADAADVEAYEVYAEDNVVAAFIYPADADLEDALVGADFAALEIPETDHEEFDVDSERVSPEDYLRILWRRREQLESRLDTVKGELKDLRLEVAGFLLAAEEHLAIEAQKREAPLSFATTENAFVAEGWIPTERYEKFETALHEAAGDHVEVEELERAAYEEHGHAHEREDKREEDHVGEPTGGAGEAITADGGEGDRAAPNGGAGAAGSRVTDPGVAADDGHAMSGGEPPVIQDNPEPVGPFELLVEVVNRPNYHELDPTIVLWLTFPTFFGFMIGDVGYGILYLAIGGWLWSNTESDALQSLGGVTLWAGGFTVLFGILYGELFGLHVVGDILWGGHPPIEKGLSPATGDFAKLWLIVSLLIGLLHLTVGWILGFVNDLSHGIVDAVTENASWILLMGGVWTWIFSGAGGNAPQIMVGTEEQGSVLAHFIGFTGFPEAVGLGGLSVAAIGFVLLLVGEGGVGALESLNILVNVLSYTRIAAVLLAKAGMAFVVNLLFFGVYVTGHGENATWHFGISHMPHVGDAVHGHEVTEIMFGGLMHGGIAAAVAGLLVLVLGHLLVLALGVTSAGLQAIRLEYVEFFQKFYNGGGDAYEPFGRERAYTTED